MATTTTIRQFLGVLLQDLPIYIPALLHGGDAWMAIRNRAERLEPAPDTSGFRCDWQWASDLYAPKVLPVLGRQLMRRALASHPILRTNVRRAESSSATPQVSFLIGHRGMSRLPHLLATLGTIAAQQDASIECVVVEQDTASQLGPHLPSWVRLVHTPPPAPAMPYCRSWAFNIAVRHAHAPILILHDNDMLVPADYAAQVLQRVVQGHEVVNLKRFVFYLTRAHTEAVFARRKGFLDAAPEAIVQNLEGGGSVAITRAAFERIGGMDESFVGWGGEDNELWERALTLRTWQYAYLPLVHLWHPAQIAKLDDDSLGQKRFRASLEIPAAQRIDRLRNMSQGQQAAPASWTTPCL